MANPGGPLSANVVHLFRHLSEPDVLRPNPLVEDIFANAIGQTPVERDAAAIAEIRKRLKWCAELCEQLDAGTRHHRRGKRQRTIVMRCDLAGEQHESVARELGICIRHFYRERRIALERVAQLLVEQRPRPKVVVVDAREATLAHAAMLAEVGHSAQAIRQLKDAAGAANGKAKVRTLALLGDMLRNFGRLEQAWVALRAAAGEARNGIGSPVEQLWLRFSEAELFSECGTYEKAEHAFAEIPALLSQTASIGSVTAIDAMIRASRALAYRAYRRGDPHEAEAYTANALRLLERSSHLPLLVRESVMHVQILSLYQLGAIDRRETQHRALEMLRFAQSAGSLEQSANLLCTLSVLANSPDNMSYDARARELAHQHGSAYLQRHIHLASAMRLLADGNPLQAIDEMNQAREHGLGDIGQQIVALDIEAKVSLFAGDTGAALTHSQRAHRLAATVGDQRARGAVMRTMAMVELRLGHLHDASAILSEAIPVIASHGSPSSLNLAMSLRDHIDRSSGLAR